MKHEPAAVAPGPPPQLMASQDSCIALSKVELRVGTPMRRIHAAALPRGELNTAAGARELNGKFVFEPLEILYYREQSAAEVEAAEAELRRRKFMPTDQAKLEVSDGTKWRRIDDYFAPFTSGLRYRLDAKIPTGLAIRAVRFTFGDEVIFDYRQPQDPPRVEAVVLREKPLQLAVRVRGFSGPVLVELAEVTPSGTEQLLPLPIMIHEHKPGADPCWLVLPPEYGFARDTGLPLRLTLVNLFYRVVFDHAR